MSGNFNFLKDGARNRDFWVFIRSVLELQREDLLSNVIWNNVFIAGKRRSMGHPETNDKLEDLSMEYLLEITKIFNPERSKVISSLEGGAVNAAALLGLYAIFTLFRIVEY